MNSLDGLLMPMEDEQMKALAASLRGRQTAADFFSASSIPNLQKMAQSEQQYIKDVGARQGVLRESLDRRKQDEEQRKIELADRAEQNRMNREFQDQQNFLQRDFMRGENKLNRTSLLQRALAPKSPLVTIGGEGDPGAKSYFTERGKADSNALDEVYAKSEASQKLLNNLDSFAAVLDGVKTGSLSGVKADLGRLGASVGIEVDPDVDKLITARAIANQLALLVRNPDSGLGMPGQVSDRDIIFLKESMPRILNTQGGNAMIIEVFKRISQREVERAQMATQYEQENGRFNKADFERKWNQHVEENGLFDDLIAGQDQQTGQTMTASDPYSSMSQEELDAEYARRTGQQ